MILFVNNNSKILFLRDIEVEIPQEVAERGGGSPSRGKGDKYDIVKDDEELLIVMEYIVKFSLI